MTLEDGILGSLAIKPLSGYEIKKLFDISAAYFWPADQTQIYRTLKKMAKNGLVELKEQKKGRTVDKKVYAITDDGRSQLVTSIRDNSIGDFISRESCSMQIFLSGALSLEEQLALVDTQLENNDMLLREVEDSFQESKAAFVALTGMPAGDRRYQSAIWARRWGVVRVTAYSKFLMQIRQEILKEKEIPVLL